MKCNLNVNVPFEGKQAEGFEVSLGLCRYYFFWGGWFLCLPQVAVDGDSVNACRHGLCRDLAELLLVWVVLVQPIDHLAWDALWPNACQFGDVLHLREVHVQRSELATPIPEQHQEVVGLAFLHFLTRKRREWLKWGIGILKKNQILKKWWIPFPTPFCFPWLFTMILQLSTTIPGCLKTLLVCWDHTWEQLDTFQFTDMSFVLSLPVTSRILFFCPSLTLPARQQWDKAFWMMCLFDLALGSLYSLGPAHTREEMSREDRHSNHFIYVEEGISDICSGLKINHSLVSCCYLWKVFKKMAKTQT